MGYIWNFLRHVILLMKADPTAGYRVCRSILSIATLTSESSQSSIKTQKSGGNFCRVARQSPNLVAAGAAAAASLDRLVQRSSKPPVRFRLSLESSQTLSVEAQPVSLQPLSYKGVLGRRIA